MDRQSVPFGQRWGMQIQPNVSVAVRSGGIVATCGQCDLDPHGAVVGRSLLAQTRSVGAHLVQSLREIGSDAAQVGRLEAFYVPETGVSEELLRSEVLASIPGIDRDVDLLLVPLPYFYYQGLKIELDAQLDERGRLNYVSVDSGPGPIDEAVRRAFGRLEEGLRAKGTSFDRTLLLRTYFVGRQGELESSRGDLAEAVPCTDVPIPYLPASAGPVRMAAIAASGHDTIRRAGVPDLRRDSRERIIASRTAEGIIFVGGLQALNASGAPHLPGDAVGQAEDIMTTLSDTLKDLDSGLSELVKVGVHYRGGPTAEDLHRNLEVRMRHYPTPGPASTGVPVPQLQPSELELVLDCMAVATVETLESR